MFKWFKRKTDESQTVKVKEVKAVSPIKGPVFKMPEQTVRKQYVGGKQWTEDEDNIILSFYNLGVNATYISEALTKAGFERSTNAVQIRISRLNKNAVK